MANAGITVATFAPIVNLLPRKIDDLSAPNANTLLPFALITGTGALAALLGNLGAGWLSDHYLKRLHGRRQWGVLGVVAGFVALLLLPLQSGLPGVLLIWTVAQIAINFLVAPLAAFLPDQVATARRAQASALIALALIVGVVVAGAVGALTSGSADEGFVVVAAIYLVLTAPAIIALGADGASAPVHVPMTIDVAVVSDRAYTDFRWAWLTRFAIILSASIALLYLYHYLDKVLRLHDPSQRQFELLTVLAAFLVVGSISGGRLSDRTGKRKPLVIASLVTVGAAQLILAALPHWPATIVAAALVGVGFGGFLAVDPALTADVLPNEPRYARDLSIMNISSAAPQVVAPAIAAAFTYGRSGYVGLYGVAALLSVTAIGFVRSIRSVP